MNEERRFYVYAYLRSRASKNGNAGTPYYIGKGSGDRAYQQHNVPVPKDKNNIVFLGWNMTEADALQAEMLLIYRHGRIDLCTGCLRNLTDGGEGQSGRTFSEDTRRKMSEAAKARPSNRKGKSCSDEHRRRVSEAKLGVRNGFYGKNHSEESKCKIAAARTGTTHSDETRRKISEGLQRRKQRKEAA